MGRKVKEKKDLKNKLISAAFSSVVAPVCARACVIVHMRACLCLCTWVLCSCVCAHVRLCLCCGGCVVSSGRYLSWKEMGPYATRRQPVTLTPGPGCSLQGGPERPQRQRDPKNENKNNNNNNNVTLHGAAFFEHFESQNSAEMSL